MPRLYYRADRIRALKPTGLSWREVAKQAGMATGEDWERFQNIYKGKVDRAHSEDEARHIASALESTTKEITTQDRPAPRKIKSQKYADKPIASPVAPRKADKVVSTVPGSATMIENPEVKDALSTLMRYCPEASAVAYDIIIKRSQPAPVRVPPRKAE